MRLEIHSQLLSILILAGVGLSGCSGDSDTMSASEFCDNWGERACTEEVVSVCQAPDVEACRQAQSATCLERIPANLFSAEAAAQCLDAVRRAHEDADLTAEELQTTLRLEAPCDQLIAGPVEEGEDCTEHADCNTPAGYTCVFKGGEELGTCQIPVVVDPGYECDDAASICTAGFFCDGNNCIANRDPGDACDNDDECGRNGFCDSSGTCQDALELNDECDADVQCAAGICYEFSAAEQVCTDRIRLSRSEPICDDYR